MSSAGLVLTVESSSDLSNWHPLQTFTNTTTMNTFTDTNVSGRIQSFYRVVVPKP
jgi:beta-xylosidase